MGEAPSCGLATKTPMTPGLPLGRWPGSWPTGGARSSATLSSHRPRAAIRHTRAPSLSLPLSLPVSLSVPRDRAGQARWLTTSVGRGTNDSMTGVSNNGVDCNLASLSEDRALKRP